METKFAMDNQRLREIAEKARSGGLGPDLAIGSDLGGIVYAINFDRQAVDAAKERYAARKEDDPILPHREGSREPVSLGEIGDRGMATAKDSLDDMIRRGEPVSSVRDTSQVPEHKEKEKSNTSMMYLGLAAVAIAMVYFNSSR